MTRLALLLLPLVALVACGGGDPETVADVVPEVRVEVELPDPIRVGPLTWTVTIVNDAEEAVDLEFVSSRRADVTLSRDGEDVYRWSRGLLFTQDISTERVSAGEKRTFRLDEPGLDVDPGEYTLTASVTATGQTDLDVTRTVTVEAMR